MHEGEIKMNELLKKLLEAQVLSEETRNALDAAFKVQLQEAVDLAKKEATEQIRVELTEQWITDRDALIEAIDDKVEDYLKQELTELQDDIAAFRNLEAEYAARLVETKGKMAGELQGDLAELIEKLDSFLEIRLSSEFEELREDIKDTKKLQFGKKVFESFVQEYRKSFVDGDATEAELRDVRESYQSEVEKRKQAEHKVADMQRKIKLEKVLKPLNGKQHEIMETILKNVPTNGLEEAYKTFIGRVLRESEDTTTSEKETRVLAESKSEIVNKFKKGIPPKGSSFRTGNVADEDEASKEEKNSQATKTVVESWKHLAGL
jgi:hypothetical protein